MGDKGSLDVFLTKMLDQVPNGEYTQAFNACETLTRRHPDAAKSLDNHLKTSAPKHLHRSYMPVDLSNGQKTVISDLNFIQLVPGGGRYFDPRLQKTFTFDYLNKTVSDIQPATNLPVIPASDWRSSIQTVLDAYISSHYFKHGAGVVFPGAKTHKIVISSFKHNGKALYSGSWYATYDIPAEFTDDTEIVANIAVQTHYYEDCNVMYNHTTTKILKPYSSSSATKAPGDLISAIMAFEVAQYDNIFKLINRFCDVDAKEFVRRLPKNGTKYKWLRPKLFNTATH